MTDKRTGKIRCETADSWQMAQGKHTAKDRKMERKKRRDFYRIIRLYGQKAIRPKEQEKGERESGKGTWKCRTRGRWHE